MIRPEIAPAQVMAKLKRAKAVEAKAYRAWLSAVDAAEAAGFDDASCGRMMEALDRHAEADDAFSHLRIMQLQWEIVLRGELDELRDDLAETSNRQNNRSNEIAKKVSQIKLLRDY